MYISLNKIKGLNLTLKQSNNVKAFAESLIEKGFDENNAITIAKSKVISKSLIPTSNLVKDQQISYEIIYEPYSLDAHGNWASCETLQKAMENYNNNNSLGTVSENLFHLQPTDSFTIIKTYIQPELDVIVQSTGQEIKAGTWVGIVKYNDSKIWELKKAGIISGLSVQCSGIVDEVTGEILEFNFDLEEDN